MRGLRLTILTLALAAPAAAARPADAGKIGRWTIDLAGSRFPAAAPADDRRTYEDAGDGLVRSSHVVTNPDGSVSITRYEARDDGRDALMEDGDGRPAGTIALTRSGPGVQAFVTKRDGKIVAQGRTILAADGRTLTIRLRLPQRPATEYRMIYRRADPDGVGERR